MKSYVRPGWTSNAIASMSAMKVTLSWPSFER